LTGERLAAQVSFPEAAAGARWWGGACFAIPIVLGACRAAPPAPFPGGSVSLSVRVSPAGAEVDRIVATADGAHTATLRPRPHDSEFVGQIPVAGGRRSIVIEAVDPNGARLGAATAEVWVERGSAAQVVATVSVGGSSEHGPARPAIESLVTPRTSVAQGEEIPLEGRLFAGMRVDARFAWTADPLGCGVFASPQASSTSWTAAMPGACTLEVSVSGPRLADRRTVSLLVRSRGSSYQYPLRVGAGGRHLVDRRGVPFLIKGEAAWLALVNLSEEEQERYLGDRAAKGFNLVEVMLMNRDYTESPNPTPPANRRGEEPFGRSGDFSTPNGRYFDRVVAFVDRAAAHGLVVLIAPCYLGFDGGPEGWWEQLVAPANTRDVCFRFGAYLGERLNRCRNVIWLAGGDFAPPPGSEGEARLWHILRGIQSSGSPLLWTGHWNLQHLGGIATDEPLFRDAMDLNGVYQYADTYRYTKRAYEVQPPRPVFLLESTYEHEHPGSSTQPFRKAWWWTMLSGGSGVVWGNLFLWMCEPRRGTYRAVHGDADGASSSWARELDSDGTHEALGLHAFFEALPWWRLVPEDAAGGAPDLVTEGRGWGRNHIAAAATPERNLIVAYVPPTGRHSRSFRLDLSRMSGEVLLRWYDPVTGAFLDARLVRGTGGVDVQTPGINGGGWNDWALVAESSPRPSQGHLGERAHGR